MVLCLVELMCIKKLLSERPCRYVVGHLYADSSTEKFGIIYVFLLSRDYHKVAERKLTSLQVKIGLTGNQ